MQDKARDDLARLFTAELEKAGLHADAIVTFATPRRLALIARDLPAETAAVSEEVKGPRVGAPPQALEGFLRKTGLTATNGRARRRAVRGDRQARPRDRRCAGRGDPGDRPRIPLAQIDALGRGVAIDRELALGPPAARHRRVARRGVVPCEIAGVQSGAATLGHRFHHPGPITIGSAADYAEKLHACHVIVDQDERRAIIRERRRRAGGEAGLELIADEGLVAENAGLTEWPVPLLGRFDEDFLAGPARGDPAHRAGEPEIFRVPRRRGQARQRFVCTANIDAADGGAKIVEGNRKVLAARLSDARFFYDTDLKVPLEEQAKKLEKIVFHEKLGTVADKVERVAKLARWLVEEGIVPLPGGEGVRAVRACRQRAPRPTPTPTPPLEGTVAKLAEGRTRRAAGQGRPRHRHGRRIPRTAGPDGRLLRRRAGRGRRGRRGGARSLQAGRAGRRRPDRAGDGGG